MNNGAAIKGMSNSELRKAIKDIRLDLENFVGDEHFKDRKIMQAQIGIYKAQLDIQTGVKNGS